MFVEKWVGTKDALQGQVEISLRVATVCRLCSLRLLHVLRR